MRLLGFLVMFIGLSGFSSSSDKEVAFKHIQNLKSGVLLVRLHTQEAMLAKMKFHGLDKKHKYKKAEILEANTETYIAFSRNYTFSKVEFFYGTDSKKVKEGNFDNIFIGDDMKIDTSIHIPKNVPIYVLDVGDIYFPQMSGHQEGVIVMNSQLEALGDPFPYYVRKRSGMAIIKRTDADMANVLDKNFYNFYEKSQLKEE